MVIDPPLVASNISSASYTPALTASTTYFWKIVARNSAGTTTGPVWSFTTGAASTPRVFPVPGTIQAEDFEDGQNVGYFDVTAGNSGGQYRPTDVDIEGTTDTGGGYNVGWMSATEWLKYTINVGTAGSYTLEARVVHAAPSIAAWIAANVGQPLIVGPDGESAQWVGDVARRLDAPFVVSTKERYGDRDVRIQLPGIAQWKAHTPVLVDDIISSGRTMVENLKALGAQMARRPVCIGVHGIFAQDALDRLHAAGADRVVACTTIPGSHAQIDIAAEVAAAAYALCGDAAPRAGQPQDTKP